MHVELGGGRSGRPGFLNIDRLPGADVVADLNLPLPLEDAAVDELYSAHCLEHVPNINLLLAEIARVCRAGAAVEIRVPHWLHETATIPGHVHTLTERFWRMATGDFRRHWFPGERYLAFVAAEYIEDVALVEARSLFPQASDDQLKRLVPNCCHEVRFRFVVESYDAPQQPAASPLTTIRPAGAEQCILVGGGPSLENVPYGGHPLVAISSAVPQVAGKILAAVFCEQISLEIAAPHWERIDWVVVPRGLHDFDAQLVHQVSPSSAGGIPAEKLLYFNPTPCGHDAESIRHAITDSLRSGRVAYSTQGLAALSVLALAGFRSVACYGFDLRKETQEPHWHINQGLRVAAPLFQEIFGMKISFHGEAA